MFVSTVRSGILLSGLLSSGLWAADCTLDLPALSQQLYPGKSLGSMSVCKVWPAFPNKTLVALLYPSEVPPEEGLEIQDLALLVVDSQSLQPLSRLYQKQALVSDAISLSQLSFDTARYQLTAKTRAFGLRARWVGESRANPINEVELSLYVEQQGKLKPVLSHLAMNEYQGEWDTLCTGSFSQTERTLAISPTAQQGWFDLTIRSRTTQTENHLEGEDCQNKAQSLPDQNQRLSYRQGQYSVPEPLRSIKN